ncbi:hypothetical protein H0H93_015228 [Arthromyces matolae]|nr:hypothetical protein H0H93_015228 [Arthromyces matolae]
MSAPSFSSFPASYSSFPGTKTETSASCTKSTTHDKHKGERKKSRRKAYVRGHPTSTSDYRKDNTSPEGDVTSKESSRIYYFDRNGDPYNVQYGGLHAGDVPKYRLIDRKSILGLSRAWAVTHRTGKGIELGPVGQRKMRSLTDPNARALLLVPPTRRVRQAESAYKGGEVEGYLRLPSSPSQDINSESYRSITALKDDAQSGSETTDASDEDSGDESPSQGITLTAHQEKLKLLEQAIAEEPESTVCWLNILAHTLSTIPITSKNAFKARHEVTVSVLERSFATHPPNKTSAILRIRYLKAGEAIWPENKVKAEWEDAFKLGGADIWMEWLEWRIRQAENGVDGVIEDAVRLFRALGSDDDGELAKLCLNSNWKGFVERATGMFQAQAELSFGAPQALDGLDWDTQMQYLDSFWESEAPRFGEAGSRGWAAWFSGSRTDAHFPQSQRAEPMIDLDPYRQWALRETQQGETYFVPARSDSTDDPYSIVLFSDLRPFLIPLRSIVAKDAFRRTFMSFVGLHIPGFSQTLSTSALNWDDRWNLGHLTRRSYLDALFHSDASQIRLPTESVAGVIVGREKEYGDSRGPIKSWSSGVIRTLDRIEISKKGDIKAAMFGGEEIQGLDHDFIRRLFAALRFGPTDVDWDCLTLAFEAAINVMKALKLSRSFLAQNETLPRWIAHAQLELIRGRLDNARKIYQTVSQDPGFLSLPKSSDLYWCWANIEWINGNSAAALQIVLRSVGVAGYGNIATLRCKRGLDDVIRSEKDWKDREGWIKLRALLEILTGREVTSALQVFDDYREQQREPRQESLLVASLLFLYQYGVILKNAMAPRLLRERVGKAMEEYPSNTIILGLFLEGERGQCVWGRVRGILGEGGPKTKDIIRRLQEVWIAGWERGRWSAEVERTRSGLGAAVESYRTMGSYILWRICIEFEIRTGQLRTAKKLYYRAIRECPLVKELYLLAFEQLRSVFSGKELSGIGDTMAERGIRLRTGLDESIEGWEGQIEAAGDWDGGMDEIEDNARELRRLMPY